MSPFSFFQRESLSELARQLELGSYTPLVEFKGLVPGVDNVRYDVSLSSSFIEISRAHIARLIAKAGNVEDLLNLKAIQSYRDVQVSHGKPNQAGNDVTDFKRRLTELQVAALNRAKNENNNSLDLLARVAVLKFLRTELTEQFGSTLEQLRAKVKAFEGPRHNGGGKVVELREACAAFQLGKKTVLRKAAHELFHTLREVEKETLVRMRRSLLGTSEGPGYDLFVNQLIFSENGRDDHMNAEHYVMFGNFDKDPDRYPRVLELARGFLASLELSIDQDYDDLLAYPENAQELVGAGLPEESSAKGKTQRALLDEWTELLDREGALEYIVAAYETAAMLSEYSPTINAQQLKHALISREERARVESLMQEQSKLSPATFHNALRRASGLRGADRGKLAGRFLRDFMRYHRDLRRLELLNSLMDQVSVITNEKLRNLSEINSTLYEFLLPEEDKPAEERVIHHVILKADIRDSTTLTRTLFERGLNPASYFSLNFFEPVNKLLPKYEASKVFIEGDAVILALFEREGEQGFGVARTCVLAREMISIVKAYNQKSEKDGLPTLELGLGISYQDSAPMYLMDGNSRIMISKALNESDRLSSCHKGARKVLNGTQGLFSVYTFQTVEDEVTGGNPDEFLMRYNIGGIHMSQEAFAKLQQEISLQAFDLKVPTMWPNEAVRIHTGLVPLGQGLFHRIVIREGRVPRVEAVDLSLKRWTERRYFEVCTNESIYEFVEHRLKPGAVAVHA